MEAQDSNYFINNAINAPLDTWDFEDVWYTESGKYPQLRLTFEIKDVTAPTITEVTPVPSSITTTTATYHFSSTEVGTPVIESCSFGAEVAFDTITTGNLNDIAVTLSGLISGNEYSCAFTVKDASNNASNQLVIGPFRVVSNQQSVTTSGSSAAFISGFLRSSTVNNSQTNSSESNSAKPSTLTRTLKMGMSGNDVKLLQQLLNKKGFLITSKGAGSPGKETTTFKAMTKQAVMKFQKANGLKTDGVVGQKTWALLNK